MALDITWYEVLGVPPTVSGAEEIVEADRLDAVIGLAPNLFYGNGIPACPAISS